jgi:Zn-dependent protease with chaperone function
LYLVLTALRLAQKAEAVADRLGAKLVTHAVC